MDKHTIAPRLSLNYVAPWDSNYGSQIIFGANRYYGRNLLSYQIRALKISSSETYTRSVQNNVVGPWQLVPVNTRDVYGFTKLNVPYDDEITTSITQNLYMFSMTLKYIHREGKDGVISKHIDRTSATRYIWANGGESSSNIISLIIQNNKDIETFVIKHYYLFALDYTNIKRNYNSYLDELVDTFGDEWISYNGTLMRYTDRPIENYMRPITIRLNTTHTFNIWKMKWIFNNLFRFRSGYNTMANSLDKDSFIIDGVLTKVSTYRPFRINDVFNWDMRLGFEMNMYRGNIMYVNLDIYNVLNAKNMAIYNFLGSVGSSTFSAVPIYEVGRQFWLQVGHKF